MSRPVAVLVAAAALWVMAVVVFAGVGVAAGATTWDVHPGATSVATSASHRPGALMILQAAAGAIAL